ncbi:transcriptional repressor [Rhodanobacter sp. C01]|uniref:Fur family transcriptional regulator n=1 Tax=Rhodanobacter sp. C01 TaxID=1945856 RepID=UPI00098600F2|nr:transcriptional repressor [Rhodanobacter sp. C01]OOG49085.1 hypothetical protein B0E50_06705 [Rhodanobacter sp. C01]
MTETGSDALPAWEARCKSHGLLMTAPRRAILTAMLQSGTPRDAVTLLQAAREHHSATSIGTVYRLLREFEQHGLVHVQAQAHGRCRWRLRDPSQLAPAPAPGNARIMLRQVRRFLRELERLGFAEAQAPRQTSLGKLATPTTNDPVIGLLHEIAEHFGYRLA